MSSPELDIRKVETIEKNRSEINRGHPFPVVKSGIISAFEPKRIYINLYVNEGFSGGPLVYNPHGDEKERFCVAGVVTGYVQYHRPIHGTDGQAHVKENTDIGLAVMVKHVIDLIDSNPIGFQVPTNM